MKKLFTTLSLAIIGFGAIAQGVIPNGNFSTWTGTAGSGFEKCANWKLSNDTINNLLAQAGNVYENNSNGTFFLTAPSLQLFNKSYTPLTTAVKVPGVAVSGANSTITINPVTNQFSFSGGYPFTDRPDSLKGYMGYMAGAGTDTASIAVVLSKWNAGLNKRDTVAIAVRKINLPRAFGPFADTLHYFTATPPDTCMIVIMSSTSFQAIDLTSMLYVDDLSFAGIDNTQFPSPSGIGSTDNKTTLTVFPNPAGNSLTIASNASVGSKVVFVNLLGQPVKTVLLSSKEQRVDVADLQNGVYVYELINREGIQENSGRIVINK